MIPWFEEAQKQCAEKWKREVREILQHEMENIKNKEENTMKLSYKGVTGELLKLECPGLKLERPEMKGEIHSCCLGPAAYFYNLEIWDSVKRCTISFPGVSLKDVKFLGGEVTYG